MAIKLIALPGLDDPRTVLAKDSAGAPVSLAGIVRAVLRVPTTGRKGASPGNPILDSDNNDIVIEAFGFKLYLGKLNLPPGKYYPQLIIYTVDFPNGRLLASPESANEFELTIL